MAKIGNLQETPDSFDGVIRTQNFQARFWMEPNEVRHNDKSPDFNLMARSSVDGEPVQIGGAKREVKKTPGKSDVNYIRLWFNDPDAPKWAGNLAAFPDDNAPGLYNVVS